MRYLLIVVLSFAAAVQSPVDLVRAKQYREARQAMAGMAEPEDAREKIAFHRLRAAIASGLKEYENAADEMAAALALSPQDSGLLLATAVAELQAGRLDKALGHAETVESAAGAATVGDIQEKRQQYVDAARAYQKAVELSPIVEQYRVALAVELVRHATFQPAIVVLEQAVPLFPKSAKLRALLGVSYYAVNVSAKANGALLSALEIDHRFEPAFQYLKQITLAGANPADIDVMEALCKRDAVVCAALKLRNEQRDSEALATLLRAQGAVARCEAGKAFEHQQKWAAARKEMEACVKLDGIPPNLYRLARVYHHLGLTALAKGEMSQYQAAVQRESEDEARRQEAVKAFQVIVR